MGVKGSALAEMVMVMTLLALLGAAVGAMIISGAEAEKRVISDRDAHMDALVAMSYINVKLRQNDEKGKITVMELPFTNGNAIVIKDTVYAYDTWIFFYNGKLLECLVGPGEQPSEAAGFCISVADGLEMEMDGGEVTATVYYQNGGGLRSMSSTTYLRSY